MSFCHNLLHFSIDLNEHENGLTYQSFFNKSHNKLSYNSYPPYHLMKDLNNSVYNIIKDDLME